MNTILINASPKPKYSASSYFLKLLRPLVSGNVRSERLRGRSDYKRILDELSDADTVVFSLPLYVDGIPSHTLAFMKEMENFCIQKDIHFNVCCIANNGFIEGRQCAPLMCVFQNFCARSGLKWCGGIGIGGGVMLNITQILFVVNAAVFCFNMVLNRVQNGNFMNTEMVRGFLIGTLILVFMNLGVFVDILRMGYAIHNGCGRVFGEKYTRILLPSFVFILIADLFFILTSVFGGGIFRGWLKKK